MYNGEKKKKQVNFQQNMSKLRKNAAVMSLDKIGSKNLMNHWYLLIIKG